jgi:YihY family inner membrane protein
MTQPAPRNKPDDSSNGLSHMHAAGTHVARPRPPVEPAKAVPAPPASPADNADPVDPPITGNWAMRLFRRLMRSRRELERTVQVINRAGRFLLQSSLPRMAAALSYRTIFGLVPTLVIGIAVLGSFAGEDSLKNTLRDLLVYTGISQIVIDETEVQVPVENDPLAQLIHGPPVGPPDPSAPPPSPEAREAEMETSPGLEDWISAIVTRVRGIAFVSIGIIGVLTLVYAAGSMLIEIERAFNDIFHAPAARPWGRRFQLYWTMLTLGIILIIATFFIGAKSTEWLSRASPALGPGTGLGTVLTFIATVITSTVLLAALYLWVPNTRVAFRPAVAGAFVAALLWESSKLGLQRYIELSTSYAKLYGSLGLLPLLLIWIYVTWLIILFGLQVAYALQNFHTWRAENDRRDAPPPMVEPAALLGVTVEIARAFIAGRAARVPDLGSTTGVDERVVLMMTERLSTAGILHRVENAHQAFTLARPPDAVRMGDLLRMGYELAGPATGVAAELREQTVKALGDRTLASAAAPRTEPPPDPGGQAVQPPSTPATGMPGAVAAASSGHANGPVRSTSTASAAAGMNPNAPEAQALNNPATNQAEHERHATP